MLLEVGLKRWLQYDVFIIIIVYMEDYFGHLSISYSEISHIFLHRFLLVPVSGTPPPLLLYSSLPIPAIPILLLNACLTRQPL